MGISKATWVRNAARHMRMDGPMERRHVSRRTRNWRILFCYGQSNGLYTKTHVKLNCDTVFLKIVKTAPESQALLLQVYETMVCEKMRIRVEGVSMASSNDFGRKRKSLKRHVIVIAYSSNSTHANFSWFPRLKEILKNTRFADIPDVRRRLIFVLYSISKNTFPDSFQQLYKRHQKCIVANGYRFVG